jgi:polyisoprenoid-binding protein YceI
MRKIVCALSVTSALVFALAVHAAAPANFAGTWTLDKSKSQGLSQRMQGAESVSWVITQNDKEITIEEKVTGGGGPPGGGAPAGGPPGGGGQGGRGGMGMGGPRTFSLDGNETTGENGPAKFVRKATWTEASKTLELASKTTFNRPDGGGEVTTTSNEKLTLSADGKTLTVNRHSESPRGPQDSTMVFNK